MLKIMFYSAFIENWITSQNPQYFCYFQMSGSSNAAIHVIGSQIEAMNMRIDEIKKKGYAEIQVNSRSFLGPSSDYLR